MQGKFKKAYRFALISTSYITGFSVLLVAILLKLFFQLSILFLFIFGSSIFIFSFFVIQYRVNNRIYKKIQSIYDDISLLEYRNPFVGQSITTDMETLTREVQKFVSDKKVEIETLKVREEYQREFLGNISHELRTPLFTAQGYLLTLLDGAMNDKNVRKKYLQRAEKGIERLIYIVKDLDMITKLEVGELNLARTNFNIIEVIQSVFDLLEMKASKKNIMLMFDMKYYKKIMVYADREKIQQVLTNLIVNSIKYGKKDGTTEVSVENFVNNKMIIRVVDNGSGIEEQNIPRLFERFYRIDKSGSRSEGGSGLGLSIVKHIIEAHRERIYIKSQYQVGSEFSFTLEKYINL